MTRKTSIGAGLMILALVATPAIAQSSGSYNDVPDRFRIEVGGFRIGSDTQFRLNDGTGGGTDVDFEKDLSLDDTSTRFYVEGYWRVARRHQVSLSWFHLSRQGPGRTLSRDVVWGDHVFTANTPVTGEASSNYLSGVYRFAAYRNDRFEIGPSLGFGHLSLDATISGVTTIASGSGSVSRSFERTASQGSVTGDLGGYLTWWPAKRLLLRGDLRYIFIKPEGSEASVADGRASLTYHPWAKVGIGLQYTYSKFRYERDILDTGLGGSLRFSGVQLLGGVAF